MDASSLIDEFEAAWQQRSYVDVDRLLTTENLADADRAELVMIDLEYRWRYPLPADAADRAVVPNSPLVEDYCRRFPTLAAEPTQLMELVSEEYRVRLRWADAPTRDDLQARFPQCCVKTLDRQIAQVQQEVPHLWLQVVCSDTELVRLRFHRNLDLGRQAVDQPPPYQETRADGNRKLIIAALDNLQVSRNQLRLTVCGTGVRLENLSRQVSVRMGIRTRILPRRVIEHAVPLTLTIGDLELCITR